MFSLNNYTMTNSVNNPISTRKCIAQFNNFLPLFIALDGCLGHYDITRFQENKVPSIVNTLGVSIVTILDRNFQDFRREMMRRVSKF